MHGYAKLTKGKTFALFLSVERHKHQTGFSLKVQVPLDNTTEKR